MLPASTLPPHDLHNHTIHCGHGLLDATVENIVARAEEVGLSCIGFSEHVVVPEDAEHVAWVRRDVACLDRGDSRLRVLVGMEIDADPRRMDGGWIACPEEFDYAVLALHWVPVCNVGHWAFRQLGLSDAEKSRIGAAWLDWFEACVDYGPMEILAHPLREPIVLGLFSLRDDRVMDRAGRILAGAARRGVAFELNNGWASGLQTVGQFDEYVTLVRELKRQGMRFCCGSDSHGVAYVGGRDGIARLAEAAGLAPEDWIDPEQLPGVAGAAPRCP